MSKDLIQQCKKMQKQHLKILAAVGDERQLFDLVTEINDYEFVVNNIEYRLSTDLNNRNLWHRYIDYLKNTNTRVCF